MQTCCVAAGIIGLAMLRAQTIDLELVAVSGDPAPVPVAEFAEFGDRPAVSPNNMVAFEATISGTGITMDNDTGIWARFGPTNATGFTTVVREGQFVPPTGSSGDGDTYFALSNPSIANTGEVLWTSELDEDMSNAFDSGVFLRTAAGTTQIVARKGVTAPGTGGNIFSDFAATGQGALLASNGNLAFFGATQAVSDSRGVWLQLAGGSVALAAAEGLAAPGASGQFLSFGATTAGSAYIRPAVNSSGRIAFYANLTNVATGGSEGIWTGEPGGALTLVARIGGAAPGTSGEYDVLDNPVINDAGQVAFIAREDVNSDRIIYAGRPGELRIVAQRGQVVPGFPAGSTYEEFDSLSINSAGQVAYLARVALPGAGGTKFAIFATDVFGNRFLLLREDDVVDLGGGFGQRPVADAAVPLNLGYQAFSDTNRVVFYAKFSGPGTPAAILQAVVPIGPAPVVAVPPTLAVNKSSIRVRGRRARVNGTASANTARVLVGGQLASGTTSWSRVVSLGRKKRLNVVVQAFNASGQASAPVTVRIRRRK